MFCPGGPKQPPGAGHQFIHRFQREIDFELLGESSWDVVAQRGFDQPRQFLAYLNTLRWNCVTATANCLRLRMAS
jgi:hypothetical protein